MSAYTLAASRCQHACRVHASAVWQFEVVLVAVAECSLGYAARRQLGCIRETVAKMAWLNIVGILSQASKCHIPHPLKHELFRFLEYGAKFSYYSLLYRTGFVIDCYIDR